MVGLRSPVLPAACAKVDFSDHREYGESLAGVMYCFFADCQMLTADLKKTDSTTDMQHADRPGTVLETTDWQQKGRRSLEEGGSVSASLTSQTSHQLCQPSLKALQTSSYLELPVMTVPK